MKTLKKSVVTLFQVEYTDFENFVMEHYGFEKRWYFVADQECGNDCSLSFEVNGRVDSYDEGQLEKFKTDPDSSYNITNAILNDFYREGLIEKGEYQINVCW